MAPLDPKKAKDSGRRERRSRSPEGGAHDRPQAREPREGIQELRNASKSASASPSRPNKRKHSRPTSSQREARGKGGRNRSRSRSRTRKTSSSHLNEAVSNSARQPPLPNEALPPPLPNEPVPDQASQQDSDDGWEPVWDPSAQTYYFYNRFTQASQWENPRVPEANPSSTTAVNPPAPGTTDTTAPGTNPDITIRPAAAGGYNPAIHGDYDPNADYAITSTHEQLSTSSLEPLAPDPNVQQPDDYSATAAFNRYSGRFQNPAVHPTHAPEAHTDEAKSRRQMNSFFDVDAAANSHDGRSLKEERRGKRLTKEEVREFREKKKSKKEERRRAWLME
ncbi:MAG: hypothetical protein M1831_002369 [Alyxoria varia]|nr:MAG: hypothetical protein M1831_002369 [Alyxoria varia]